MGRWKIYKIRARADSALRHELFSANIRTERNRIIRKAVLENMGMRLSSLILFMELKLVGKLVESKTARNRNIREYNFIRWKFHIFQFLQRILKIEKLEKEKRRFYSYSWKFNISTRPCFSSTNRLTSKSKFRRCGVSAKRLKIAWSRYPRQSDIIQRKVLFRPRRKGIKRNKVKCKRALPRAILL